MARNPLDRYNGLAMRRLTFLGTSAAAVLIVWGCSAGGDPVFKSSGSGNEDDGSGGAGGAMSTSEGTGASSLGGGFSVGIGGSGSGGAPPLEAVVYGHSSGTLYKLDPLSNEVAVIGPFSGCSGVIDLAVDKNHSIFATTFSGLWAIDGNTAGCSQISTGSYPNSLSFVPEGTVDADAEALVGYQGSSYVRIDTTTGTVTAIGSLGGGLSSSGDIVSVIGGGTYLTVNGSGCNDCLIEVNPTTGDLIKNYGALNFSSVFGLAFWGGSAYGFSNSGDLFKITFAADSVTTSLIAIPDAPPNLSFWGAGSATSAPLQPPD